MSFKFRPTRGRLIVRPIEESETSTGGIYIPEENREFATSGIVMAVGSGNINKKGEEVPLPFKLGDKVYFHKYAGQSFDLEEKKYLIIDADRIELMEEINENH